MTAVPWIAFPKPPPVKPGAGGNCVKTDGVNSGRPFCKRRKTIENSGTRVRNESATHNIVQKLFLRILALERLSAALSERPINVIDGAAFAIKLSDACSRFFGPLEDGLSSHVNQQCQQHENECGIHQGADLKSLRFAELVGQEPGKRSGG
jgi:hypothetical protein